MSDEQLPSLLNIPIPSTPLLAPILAHLRAHTSPSTVNHSIRSAYFALLLSTKLPQYTSSPTHINLELVLLADIMHDLGWATTRSMLSDDKRFEVDGANLAVQFIEEHKDVLGSDHGHEWGRYELDALWTAIACHTSPSITLYHPNPAISLIGLGILADFFGPNLPPPFPPGLISEEEYLTIVKQFPREGFKEEVRQIFCGLCRDKPETTYDNFASEFGIRFGLDGKGKDKEEFATKAKEASIVPRLFMGLKALEKIEPEVKESKPRGEREKYWYEAE